MLAYVLALAIGLGSIAIYLAAFFFPEIHRKNDFIWSGVGLFYALILWVFAQRITGGLLLGHVASVALLYWFGWQTLSLRQQLTPTAQQTQIPSADTVKTTIQQQVTKLSLPERLSQLQKGIANAFTGVKDRVQQTVSKKTPKTPKTGVTTPAPGKSAVDILNYRTPTPQQPTESQAESVPELIPPNPPSPELVEAAKADTETLEPHPPIPSTQAQRRSEEKTPLSVEEIAPPEEAPPGQVPPSSPSQNS